MDSDTGTQPPPHPYPLREESGEDYVLMEPGDFPGRDRVIIETSVRGNLSSLDVFLVGRLPQRTRLIDDICLKLSLCLVFRGEAVLKLGNTDHGIVKAPFVFCRHPGTHARFGPVEGTSLNQRFLVFEGPRAQEWINCGWIPGPEDVWLLPYPDDIARMHEEIVSLYPIDSNLKIDRIKLKIEQILLLIQEGLHEARPQLDNHQKVRAIADIWRKAPLEEHNLKQAASSIGISETRFRELFHEEIGLTPYQFILEMRIKQACNLLTTGDQTGKEIAFSCAFQSAENFCRIFRKKLGMTPMEYRRQFSLQD